ncbi:MAG: RidA family protein [Alphaproteobacteria bacterium]
MSQIGRHNIPESKTATAYNHVVFDGDYAFLAGQLAADRADGRYTLGDIEAETRTCMELLGAALRSIGLGFADVVQARVFMTDLSEFERMNKVFASFFPPGQLPARTTVGVASLLGGTKIEIDFIARMRKPEQPMDMERERRR